MTYSPAILAEHLVKLQSKAGKPARFVIAFSGGLDSTVLAQSLSEVIKSDQRFHDVPAIAIHINHDLHSDSPDWSEKCAAVAAELGLGFRSLRVNVQLESGKGPEASARDARYSALHAQLSDGDWLLSAHHREDQAETLLLNLIRGSGPSGVAGIGDARHFGPGWLIRPMLNVERGDILAYANDIGLSWVEDPSNRDRRFDRNFLRHEVLPRLKARWPDIAARLQRSAGHAGEASQLLSDLGELDLAALGSESARLPVDKLKQLSAARQRNVIRFALRDLGLSTPTAMQLERVRTEVIPARIDAQPLVSWRGASVRRYRNGLYLMPEKLADAIETVPVQSGKCELGTGLGTLIFEPSEGPGLSRALLDEGLTIRPRLGGEEIRAVGQTHTSKLKKLLQEKAVVPWMRDRLPLIYAGDQLLAVGDLWMADEASADPGLAIRWIGRPALH